MSLEMKTYIDSIETALKGYLPHDKVEQQIILEAMEYSLMAGGKRIRPILMLEFCRMTGGDRGKALPFACALEMIHTYSLIHDDLPCMDDDDLRRGKPTSHKVFGEANAVLAGDALLTYAFETMLTHSKVDPAIAVKAMKDIAVSAGWSGMIGGQILDLKYEETDPTVGEVEHMDALKTGALIQTACRVGCILGSNKEEDICNAEAFGHDLGVAFQIRDDLLDVIGDEKVFGKPIGSDEASNKSTYVKFYGIPECQKKIEELSASAIDAVAGYPDNGFLVQLVHKLAGRQS